MTFLEQVKGDIKDLPTEDQKKIMKEMTEIDSIEDSVTDR